MRAVVLDSTPSVAEVAFVYEGPSETTQPLANGEVRRQIGLKLRAKDTCNVVYVMWRVEPTPGLSVQVKSNPGKSRHAECGANGYRSVTPARARPVGPPGVGVRHVLRAALQDDMLTVSIDGQETWHGPLGRDSMDFDGPVGIRTDNGRFRFELAALVDTGLWKTGCQPGLGGD
jgi:hypothetical protein